MLKVRVHTDDSVPAAVVHARDHSGLVAEIAGKIYHLHLLISRRQFLQNFNAAILASVIDENKFKIPAQAFQYLRRLRVKLAQRQFLIIAGYDDR